MTDLLQILLSGISTGAIYSLAALGFTVVFNATKVTNFANGEFMMMGGLLAATLVGKAEWPMPIAVLAAILITAALGIGMDRLGVRQAVRKTVLGYAMVTIGFGLFYKGIMQVVVGREILFMPGIGLLPDLRFGKVYFGSQSVWVLLSLLIVSLSLTILFLRTRLGKGMRAASQSPRAAALCGIEAGRMSALSFAIAAAIGALGGVLVAPTGGAFYDYGIGYGLKGFSAAVLGGFGSPTGAVIGGLLIGLLESLSAGYISSGYKDAMALSVLLLLLLFRPSGLMGQVEAKRV